MHYVFMCKYGLLFLWENIEYIVHTNFVVETKNKYSKHGTSPGAKERSLCA